MTFQEKNQRKLDGQFSVVWHGGKVDESGTRGGLLPTYKSQSSWSLVEEALRTRWEFAKRQLAAVLPDD